MEDEDRTPISETSLTNLSETQHVLTAVIDEFLVAWGNVDELGPPMITDFLPEDLRQRDELLCELIKIDLEMRWQEFHLPKRLVEYCEEIPDLKLTEMPVELVYEEYFCRQRAEGTVTIRDYYTDFPHHADALKQLALNSPHETLIRDPLGESHFRDIQPGEQIDDFDLLVRLGEGAFASVFLARQLSMQRLVAVKVSANRGTEPQTLAQLDHDYIVRVYDQRIIKDPPLRLLYMQYLPGGTLSGVVKRVQKIEPAKRTGQLLLDVIDRTLEKKGESSPTDSTLRKELKTRDWPEVVAWIGIRLAKALGYASGMGVLHRDLKPANVLLTAEGIPKLADFNISFNRQVSGADAAAYFGGSLAYMSPEQLKACLKDGSFSVDDLDVRADLFSLGVVLWELLTGERPFLDKTTLRLDPASINQMVQARQNGVTEEIRAEKLSCSPPGMIRILAQCLEPDRNKRWQSSDEIVRQLETCLEPRARELIDPQPGSWRESLGTKIVTILLLLNLVPNLFSAVANFLYNDYAIFQKLDPGRTFELILAVVNGIAFPIGILIVIALAMRIRKAIRNPHQFKNDKSIRGEALLIGHRCAQICLSLWAIAGIAYPIAIQSTGTEVPFSAYAQFFGSLLIFGLMATAYPFFGVTLYGVQVLYPAMRRLGVGQGSDRDDLLLCRDRLRLYLVMAASIPLLAVAAFAGITKEIAWLAQVLCFAGMIAFAASFWLYRRIEDDIEIMLKISSET